MRIKYLGQSGFLLQSDTSSLLIDPAKKQDGEIEGQLVYCTHKHSDHTNGVKKFLDKNKDAILLGNSQVISSFSEFQNRTVLVDLNDPFHKDSWRFEFIKGQHGLFKGVENIGIIVSDGEITFGHPGDTTSLSGFYNKEIDVLAVPIGGAFTASPNKILQEIPFFKKYPSTIVPIHWLVRRPASFCRKLVERFPEIQCIVPEKGKFII